MTEQKRTSRRLQHAARERIKATGEKYTTALQAVRGEVHHGTASSHRCQALAECSPAVRSE